MECIQVKPPEIAPETAAVCGKVNQSLSNFCNMIVYFDDLLKAPYCQPAVRATFKYVNCKSFCAHYQLKLCRLDFYNSLLFDFIPACDVNRLQSVQNAEYRIQCFLPVR